MKSLSNKVRTALIPLLLLGGYLAPSMAGVSKFEGSVANAAQIEPAGEPQRAGGNEELPTSVDQSQRNASDSVIRCWQYGRLIIDERDWTTRGDEFSGPVMYSKSGYHGKMRLMQFGDTFCAHKYEPRGR